MTKLTIAFASLVLSAAAGAQSIVGRDGRTYNLTERVSAGGEIGLFALNGTITVTESSGGSLEYRAEKIRGDADDIGFVVLRSAAGITVCAVYDEDDECREGELRSNRRRNWSNWGDRARVNLTVSVPRGTRLRVSSGNGAVSLNAAVAFAKVSSGNGKVRVTGVQGEVSASSGNGEVTVENAVGPVRVSSGNGDVIVGTVNGPVTASSGNGDILVSMDKLTGSGDLEFTTGNGRIEVTVPADFSADVEASTGSGSITTDFPIKLIGRLSRNRLRGTIGEGTRQLRMTSGNGSMEIRKK